jgi:hypothetical protein
VVLAGPAAADSAAACPCSLWSTATTPGNAAETSDRNAVELGVKFRPGVDGTITALRFYKAATNTGVHVGNLWSAGGTRLATVTFGAETSSGWQQASLSSPVAVTAGTTYIASYHAPNGNYAFDSNYFATAVVNGPLRALSSSEGAGNGVYSYGASAFPANPYNATNYWVDVVFSEAATGPGADRDLGFTQRRGDRRQRRSDADGDIQRGDERRDDHDVDGAAQQARRRGPGQRQL